tara:strand:- start:1323 stop:3020 length:1698 start_codon:yes stop_codon:yes gene_type:complete
MPRLIKKIILLLIPLFLLFSYTVIKKDFRLAHQTSLVYNTPFPWQTYILKAEMAKIFQKLRFIKKNSQFSKVKITLNKKSSKKLLGNTPNSTKDWVKASLKYENNLVQNIELRYRGDNPWNWLMEKKSYRIKLRKNELINNSKYLEYFPFSPTMFFSSKLSSEMDLLTLKPKLIELYINGISNGMYVEFERLNENFLKKNNINFANIYKGENHASERYIGLNNNLFNNTELWSKVSAISKNSAKNKSDLNFFLESLIKNENKSSPDLSLDGFIDLNIQSKFFSFLTISQNNHHDYFHNMRLVFNTENGKVTQLLADSQINSSIDPDGFLLDFSSNDLSSFLNKNTDFIDQKYKWIYYYVFKRKIIDKLISYYKSIRPNLKIVEKREPHSNDGLRSNLIKSDVIIQKIKSNKKNIEKLFGSKPNSTWNPSKKGFKISIKGHMPAANIKLYFKNNPPKWIGIDEDYNNRISLNEKKIYLEGSSSTILLPIRIYSNRIKSSKNLSRIDQEFRIKNINTKFNFITENNNAPYEIIATNPFNKKEFILKKENSIAVKTNKYNKVLINSEI